MSLFVLVVFYLPLVLWVLKRIWNSPRWHGIKKAGILILALILAYAIPLGDVTVNSLAMAKVCPTAGLHIYKTMEVEGFVGHYDLKNSPYRFIEFPAMQVGGTYLWDRFEKQPDGSISMTRLKLPTAEYEVLMGGSYAKFNGYERGGYDQKSHTEKDRWVIRNRLTGDVIAEWLFFRALPGWVDRFFVYRWFGTGGSALSCTWGSNVSGWREKVLIPKHPTN